MYAICVECYGAEIPEQIMQNDIYLTKNCDERELFIHRKMMHSLHRIS